MVTIVACMSVWNVIVVNTRVPIENSAVITWNVSMEDVKVNPRAVQVDILFGFSCNSEMNL